MDVPTFPYASINRVANKKSGLSHNQIHVAMCISNIVGAGMSATLQSISDFSDLSLGTTRQCVRSLANGGYIEANEVSLNNLNLHHMWYSFRLTVKGQYLLRNVSFAAKKIIAKRQKLS